jgi:hypothetical protein
VVSRNLARDSPRLPRRERRVKLSQPAEHLTLEIAHRRHLIPALLEHRLHGPRVEAVLYRCLPPRAIEIPRGLKRPLRRATGDRKSPFLRRHQPAAALERVKSLRRIRTLGAPRGDDRFEGGALLREAQLDRVLHLMVA